MCLEFTTETVSAMDFLNVYYEVWNINESLINHCNLYWLSIYKHAFRLNNSIKDMLYIYLF